MHLPAALRPVVGGVNTSLISFALIALLVFVVRRRAGLRFAPAVAVPAVVAGCLAALFVRRELPVYLAIVGAETLLIAAAAAVGAALAHRGRSRTD